MAEEQTGYPIRGFILLPTNGPEIYRGIDRNPFLPSLIDEEMNEQLNAVPHYISDFYGPGWRRDAYRLYEENAISREDPDVLANVNAARQILKIIEPHGGQHEIVACEIMSLGEATSSILEGEASFLGYDMAYSGGDFFSAVRAGLFGHRLFKDTPNVRLCADWKNKLNASGLFDHQQPALDYLRAFKREVPSEQNADFFVWALASIT